MAKARRSANGKGWVARWRIPGRRSRSKTFPTQAEATRYATMMQAAALQGTYIDPAAGKVTFGDFATKWTANQVHSRGTALQVEGNLRLHVLPILGRKQLRAISRSDIQGLVKKLSTTLAPGTVEVVYRYVVAILRAAVGDKLIPESPCVNIKLPRQEPNKVVPFTVEQVEKMAEAVAPRYRAMVVLAAGSGLRQGECFGLTVDRVDFERGTVTVDRQIVLHAGTPPHLAPPKTDASYRTVPVSAIVLDTLTDHLATYPQGPDGLIFTNDKGQAIRRNSFGEMWRKAARAAGLREGTGMHDLRHTYASLLIRKGLSVKVVQARLGHATATETLETYAHLWPDDEDRTREAIEEALGHLGRGPQPAS